MSELATPLNLETLFAGASLSDTPSHARLSDDGRYCAWLQPVRGATARLELWVTDTEELSPWRPLEALNAGDETLSDAEIAHRERLRIFSGGVVSFEWRPGTHDLVVPIGGQLLLCTLRGRNQPAETRDLAGGQALSHARCSPDGTQLAAIAGGNLLLIDLGSSEQRWLTSEQDEAITCGLPDFIAQEEMHRFDGYWWAPTSDAIAWTRVDESPIPITHRHEIDADEIRVISQRYPYAGGPNADVELWVSELNDDTTRKCQLDLDDRYLGRVTWTPDGREVVVQVQSRMQDRLDVIRISRASCQPDFWFRETSESWINLFDGPAWPLGASSTDAALWISESNDLAQLFLVDADGERTTVTPEDIAVEQLHACSNGVAYFDGWQRDPRQRHLFSVDLTSGSVARLTPADGTWQCSLGGGWAAAQHSSTAALPSLQLLKLQDHSIPVALVANDPANSSEHPFAGAFPGMPATRWVELDAADGQRLYGRLWCPRAFDESRRWPVLVSVYGGPGVQRVRDQWQLGWAQYLVQNGWLVFELDNRGTGNRGRRFEAPIHRRMGTVEVEDQLVGVDWLTQQPWVDPDRIGVYGHSYGGYMTLQCLIQAPEVFVSGISVAPVSTWDLYDTHYTERYMGFPGEQGDGYAAADVLAAIERLQGQLLLIHGMADDNVLFTHCTRLIKALQDRNKPFELMTYPGSKHGLAEPTVALHRFTLMTDFLRRTLPPGGR